MKKNLIRYKIVLVAILFFSCLCPENLECVKHNFFTKHKKKILTVGAIAVATSLLNLLVYFFSDSIVLHMHNAQPIDCNVNKEIYDIVGELCANYNMPTPKLWYVPTDIPNAFATGRNVNHASVAVTKGILNLLDKQELRAVLAHEISHIKNRDMLITTVVSVVSIFLVALAKLFKKGVFDSNEQSDQDEQSSKRNRAKYSFMITILKPFAKIITQCATTLIQLSISRLREYKADETGAHCCQDPLALASALKKLNNQSVKIRFDEKDNVVLSSAMSNLYFMNYLSGRDVINLLSTHPPAEKRIAKLEEMAKKMNQTN
jgi:heat shock protein HtpX